MKRMTLLSIGLILIGMCGCASHPVTGRKRLVLFKPSEQQQIQLGRSYAPQVEAELDGEIDDPVLQQYVNSIAVKVAQASHKPHLEYKCTAVNSDMVNALALPGGPTFITRGLLETLKTEDQLAAVLAHETAHVALEHSADIISQQIGMELLLSAITTEQTPQTAVQIAQLSSQLVGLRYSREFEKEADAYGTDYLVAAGYSPHAMIDVMGMLQTLNTTRQLEFFSTHPSPDRRLGLIQDRILQKGYKATARTSGSTYNTNVRNRLK